MFDPTNRNPLRTRMHAELARLLADTRGALMVEYSVLVGAVAIAGSIGLVVVGIAVAKNFDFIRGMLLLPIP